MADPHSVFRDIAWAKLNLTLEVLGRRGDGFHELRSLVAFAGLGDSVEFTPQTEAPANEGRAEGAKDKGAKDTGDGLDIEGPFKLDLEGPNLIIEAAKLARVCAPNIAPGRFRLVKTLPVASGLGGGSADAAAALRLIAKAAKGGFTLDDGAALAPKLGSDVVACLRSVPALMSGRGEIVDPVLGFPECGLVLANSGVQLATPAVYGALDAVSVEAKFKEDAPLAFGGDFEALIDYALPRANDLEAPAKRLAPEIGEVLAAMSGLKGARLVRLSGSGATCFALFASPREALRASILLAGEQPNWWIAATRLGAPQGGAL